MSTTHRELWAALSQQPLPAGALLPATLAAEASFNAQASGLASSIAPSPQLPPSPAATPPRANSSSSNASTAPATASPVSAAGGPELVIANAVWTNQTQVLPAYASSMARLFGATVRAVNSTAPINAWAANVTRGLIPKAVPDGTRFEVRAGAGAALCLPAGARTRLHRRPRRPHVVGMHAMTYMHALKHCWSSSMLLAMSRQVVLTNAVYFKGAWLHAFEKAATSKREFTTAANTSVEVRGCARTSSARA